MSKKGSFWGTLFGYTPPRSRFTIEELRSLRDTLIKNSTVTEANKDLVVETLRLLAELPDMGRPARTSILRVLPRE